MPHSLPLVAGLLLALAAGRGHAASNKSDGVDIEHLSKEVVFQLFTRHNTGKPHILDVRQPELLENSPFNPLVPTKVIVHGWLSGQKREKGAGGPLLKDAILEVSDYNVILVDWSGADSINYVAARLRVSSVGTLVGRLLDQLVWTGGMDTHDVHLVGHSLGAHIMGFAARNAGLGDTGRITALDPAGPLFTSNVDERLDKSDAGFVDVIHTCAGYLGYHAAIGHADFYPNDGTWVQPGCGLDFGACSHCRSYSLLLESIESPDAFVATACDSWAHYKKGACQGNATAVMGFGLDRRARGSFYVATNRQPPYSTTANVPASDRLKLTKNFQHC
ncbi:inactive pancreatic lipase-related protein 1-like [Thrips palmi]|uniref:Inactive pancreatic lipase-related protein 1-like n=1 Tax=Thrips palmi TaxID=161013 RepID=A0A6P8ZQR5_THRPL|nr:inactive pancreatic lipase-related protein 1-like [Thrips palmi]